MLSLRVLAVAAALLALAVTVLGAYVRLRDAGLGCPDWPGCYGQLLGVPEVDADGRPVDTVLAWIEVSHRYLAGALGLLILAAALVAWTRRLTPALRFATAGLLVLVVFQALLGALTVTRLLQPVIVTGHLLGGMGLLALLMLLAFRLWRVPGFAPAPAAQKTVWAFAACVVAVAVQIALGGWVSANYAGLACGTDFPQCKGSWLPPGDWSAFALDRQLSQDAEGKPITARALAQVQWVHRAGALALLGFAALLAALLAADKRRWQAALLVTLILTQLGLGIYIVKTGLPLRPSLLHNAFAALLCALLGAVAASFGTAARQR